MALDQAANFVRETVTSAISAGDTTINVADASPFPVPPEGYNIVVWDGAAYVRPDQDPDVEIMRVTDTDTTNDTLTVARGQEGTSDFNHPDTSVVVVAQTAKMIADIASEKISNPVTETVNADGNDVTNVGALETGELFSRISGARLAKDSQQTIPNNTITEIRWDTATEKNDSADQFADISNNALVIPNSDYSYARMTTAIRTTSPIQWSLLIPSFNGSLNVNGFGRFEPKSTWQSVTFITDWVSVSSGDSFGVEFRHTEGEDVEIDSEQDRVWLALEAV